MKNLDEETKHALEGSGILSYHRYKFLRASQVTPEYYDPESKKFVNAESEKFFMTAFGIELEKQNFLKLVAEVLLIGKSTKKMIEMVKEGANIHAKDLKGRNALHWAVGFNCIEEKIDETTREVVVKALINLGVPQIKSEEGETPLDIAEKRGYKKVIFHLKNPVQEPLMEEEEYTITEIDKFKRSWSERTKNSTDTSQDISIGR